MRTRVPSILISTYGSHLKGVGHVIRDMSLASSFRRDARVAFHFDSHREGEVLLGRHKGSWQIVRGSLRQAIQSMRPNLLLYDRPYRLGRIGSLGPKPWPRIVALDYFYYADARVDTAINIKNHYLTSSKAVRIGHVYEGIKYAIVREEIRAYRRRRQYARGVARNILVTFGGADPHHHTETVLRLLDSWRDTHFNVVVVVGPLFKMRKNVLLSRVSPHTLRFEEGMSDLGALIQWADIAFCGGGVTMAELLCLGCPTAVLPQMEDEHALARDVAAKKAIVLLNPHRQRTIWKRKITALLTRGYLRERLGRKGLRFVDGKGQERIKAIILKQLARHHL